MRERGLTPFMSEEVSTKVNAFPPLVARFRRGRTFSGRGAVSAWRVLGTAAKQ